MFSQGLGLYEADSLNNSQKWSPPVPPLQMRTVAKVRGCEACVSRHCLTGMDAVLDELDEEEQRTCIERS